MLIITGLVCCLMLLLCFWGWSTLLLEFRLVWFCEPVQLTILNCTIEPARFGYRLKVQHELDRPDGKIISDNKAPKLIGSILWRRHAEIAAERILSAKTSKGYFDPKSKRTYCTGRHFDVIDKIFSPLFVLGIPAVAALCLLFIVVSVRGLVQ